MSMDLSVFLAILAAKDAPSFLKIASLAFRIRPILMDSWVSMCVLLANRHVSLVYLLKVAFRVLMGSI